MSTNHLTPWVPSRTPGLFKAKDIYLDPPIHLRSTSRVIKFLICAMLSQLTPERKKELQGVGRPDAFADSFATVAFPYKTAEVIFGKKDWDRLSGQLLSAAFEAIHIHLECPNVTFRYTFFASLVEGIVRNRLPDANGFIEPMVCGYSFSPKLIQRWTDTKPAENFFWAPQSIVKLTADTVFNSMTCIAEAALELARREVTDEFHDFKCLTISDIRNEFLRMVLSAQTVENSIGPKEPAVCPLCGADNTGIHSAFDPDKRWYFENPNPDWQCGACGFKFWNDSRVYSGLGPAPAYF